METIKFIRQNSKEREFAHEVRKRVRITSYNVCYTKLLRFSEKNGATLILFVTPFSFNQKTNNHPVL